jgi:hypothetical protein
LAQRVKATIATVAGVDTHDEAVDVELEAQVWSMAQPDFAERITAMQNKVKAK